MFFDLAPVLEAQVEDEHIHEHVTVNKIRAELRIPMADDLEPIIQQLCHPQLVII